MSSFRKIAILLVFALLAVSCGSSGDSDATTDGDSAESETTDSETETETDETEPEEESESETEPADEAVASGPSGTFRYAAELPIPGWDPQLDGRNAVMVYYDIVYDGLVNAAPDGSIVPALATDWEISETEIAFTLREGVTFHDGTPFDADAVAYNVEKVQGAPGASATALSSIAAVRIDSPTEVALELSTPNPGLLQSLALMPGRMLSPGVSPEDVAAGVPAGTGPYMIASATADSAVLELNTNYWDPSQQGFESIEFLSLTDPTARLNALLTGEVDAATLLPPQIAEVEGAGLTVNSDSLANVFTIVLNDIEGQTIPELGDIRVRQALAHAVDRDVWDNVVAANAGSTTFQIFDESSPYYVPDFEGFAYDPELARELLAEAGVTDLTIPVATWGPFLPGTLVLQQFYADIGVTLDLTETEPGGDIAAKLSGESLTGLAPSGDAHPQAVYTRFFAPGSVNNQLNGELDGLAEALATGAAGDDEGYVEMLRIAYENAWAVPVYNNPILVGYDAEAYPNLSGLDRRALSINLRELTPAG